ncbi:MAG: hypothetical protein IT375_24420 [Polyangiaceae bacterium]|nr:hypothetical protein [Polyangiaceae bacterium]
MPEVPPRRKAPPTSPAPVGESALPSAVAAGVDPRVIAAWCEWLDALATDAEAALAAAMAYKALDANARDLWLSALEHDAERVTVPRVALYAPLLAVEAEPSRRARITAAIGSLDGQVTPGATLRALSGVAGDGSRVATIVSPLYLEFVQVLACGYRLGVGFDWVRHDPIVQAGAAPRPGDELFGVGLEATALSPLVDELALVVLAHRRGGREYPEALLMFADLFDPEYSAGPVASSP